MSRVIPKLYSTLIEKVARILNVDADYFIRGGFWLTVGQFCVALLALASSTLFANLLSESAFGIYRYLIAVSLILSAFSLTGLGQSILQTAAQKHFRFYLETTRAAFIYSLGITVIGLVMAGYYWMQANTTLALGVLLVALLQPFINTFQFTPSYLQGRKMFKGATILTITRRSFIAICTITALFITKNILVLFSMLLLSTLVVNIVTHFWLQRHVNHEAATPPAVKKRFVSFAKHTSIRGIITSLANRLDVLLVFTHLGAIELAAYTVALLIPDRIKGSFKNISSLLLPKFAERNDITLIQRGIFKRSLQLLAINSAIALAYIAVAPFVYTLLFPKYPEAVMFTQIIALSFPAMIAVLPATALKASLAEKELYKVDILSSILVIMSTFILIYFFGLWGAIINRVLVRYMRATLNYWYLIRFT